MRPELLVDAVLVLVLVAYLVNGIRRGALAGVLSVAGLLVGAVVGALLLPLVAAELDAGPARALLVLAGILALAAGGQAVGGTLGRRGRGSLPEGPLRVLDSALGGVAAVLVVLVLLTVMLSAVRAAAVPRLSRAVAASAVAQGLDRVVPDGITGAADGLARSLAGGFPRVFEGVGAEVIVPVDPPVAAELGDVATRVAGSTVKVTGATDVCGTTQEGSGFVVARERVVTNAHVVQGVPRPQVQVAGRGERLDAVTVLFDPERDLAVLAVPGLRAAPLERGEELGRGAAAAVLGYPLDGPYTSSPARVRQLIQATGEDIYGEGSVSREVYSLYATVRQGNSGGPVVDRRGRLVGVVFAASLDDPDTGYALTLAESAPVLDAARAATEAVGVGECSRH